MKAYINSLGLEISYNEVDSLNDIDVDSPENHLILDHFILETAKDHSFRNVQTWFDRRILLIASSKMKEVLHKYMIVPDNSEEEIIEKLESFFDDIPSSTATIGNEVLSTREIDILKEVALGYSNKDIADRLFISINTVITHRKNITDKLGIKTIPGLTVYAMMNNIINPADVTL